MKPSPENENKSRNSNLAADSLAQVMLQMPVRAAMPSAYPFGEASYAERLEETAAIALGSNMGNSQAILEGALEALAHTSGITIEAKSSWYRTKAVGPTQPDYLNGCAILRVQISPQALLANLLAIEQQFGRVRQEHWGPRTLDLDLLLYDDLILHEPNLQIPHPRMAQRAFVLVPLAEIAPDWIDPLSQRVIQDLLLEVDTCDVHLL